MVLTGSIREKTKTADRNTDWNLASFLPYALETRWLGVQAKGSVVLETTHLFQKKLAGWVAGSSVCALKHAD
jgi:hypothetical protein